MGEQALAPYIMQSIGVDLTEGMVKEYNTSARNQGIPESEMLAVQGNLIDANNPNPPALAGKEFYDFDIAAVGLGFHHFDDPALAAKRLGERLKKGGVLFIVDFLPHQHFPWVNRLAIFLVLTFRFLSIQRPKLTITRADNEDGHKAAKTITHMGFSQEEVKKMFEDAGVGANFDYKVIGKGIVFEGGGNKMERSVFFAKGAKL